jgi:hypothetical protein
MVKQAEKSRGKAGTRGRARKVKNAVTEDEVVTPKRARSATERFSPSTESERTTKPSQSPGRRKAATPRKSLVKRSEEVSESSESEDLMSGIQVIQDKEKEKKKKKDKKGTPSKVKVSEVKVSETELSSEDDTAKAPASKASASNSTPTSRKPRRVRRPPVLYSRPLENELVEYIESNPILWKATAEDRLNLAKVTASWEGCLKVPLMEGKTGETGE